MQQVYDDEKEKAGIKPKNDGSHDNLGASPSHRAAETQELEDLLDSKGPASKNGDSGRDPAKSEQSKLDDQVGKGYTSSNGDAGQSGKRQGWITRKRAVLGGGISTLLIGGTLGFFSIGQGPFKIIHAAQLLQQFHFSNDEEFMDGRTGSLIRWSRTRHATQRRNLGALGNVIADHYETKMRQAGITPTYERERIRSLEFDTKSPRAKAALDEMRASSGLDIPSPDADGMVRVDLPTGTNSTRARRVIMRGVVGSIGLQKISAANARRILITRAGVDYHPLRNISRDLDEEIFDYYNRVREERNERRSNGDAETRNSFEGRDDTDGDGNTSENSTNNEAARSASEVVEGADAPEISNQLKRILGGGVGAATAATLICSLDQLGDSIPTTRQAQIVLPVMRIGMEIVTMGNQVMAGGIDGKSFNLDELGATITEFYDVTAEEGAEEFFGARTWQAELGQPQSGPDMPNASKPNVDRPQIFQILNQITAATGISQVCGFVTSSAGGWVVDIADWATSGGPVQAVFAAAQDVALTIGINQFADDIALWLAGTPAVVDPSGAMLGNYANYGALLAANESSIAHGGTPLSTAAAAELNAESRRLAKIDFQQKGMFDRYLNPYESRSLVAQAMIKNPGVTSSPTSAIAIALRTPTTFLSSIFSNATRALNPRVMAQTSDYDYGFPTFGFSSDIANSARYDNPYDNAANNVEPNLESYNERFGRCFGTTIDPSTFEIKTNTNEGVRYDLVINANEDGYRECNDNSQALNDYRVYLADQFAMKSLLCYEGIDEQACRELGYGAPVSSGGQQGGGTTGANVNGFVFPLQISKEALSGNSPAWCSASTSNCHHDYNAADIFAPTGTTVVAYRAGTVIRASDFDTSRVGSRVTIKGDNGNIYYYAHMGEGTIRVTEGQQVSAGTPLGQVGTSADAVGTPSHLHIDELPGDQFDARMSCSGAGCSSYPFINVQATLSRLFNTLP